MQNLELYKAAMNIGERVWKIVNRWNFYENDSLGKQFARADDSMALNISEVYGRFFHKENRNFCFYGRGSAYEVRTALIKARQRNLIQDEDFLFLQDQLDLFFKLINGYIRSIGNTISK